MATAVSSVDAALNALVAAVTAQVAALNLAPTPSVYDGPPADGPSMPDDLIVIGEQIDQLYTPHALVGSGGAGWLQEEYNVSIVVDCYRGDNIFRTVRQVCTTLANAVDAAIRNDPSLGGVVLRAYPESKKIAQSWEPNNKGVMCRADMNIRILAIP